MSNQIPGPDFICIGMPKAGTGWLFDQLRYHPDFWMPPVKELAFLKNETSKLKRTIRKRLERLEAGVPKNVERIAALPNRRSSDTRDLDFLREVRAAAGEPMDLDRYGSLFRFKETALSGDVTPGYAALDTETIRRVANRFPNIKIVLLVREPVERAWSRIAMWHRRGILDQEILESRGEFSTFLTSERFVRESFPSRTAERWQQNAPNLAFQSFFFDDIVQRPADARRDILAFLGADAGKPSGDLTADENKKANSEKLGMSDMARSMLVECFKEELEACAETFGGPAKQWGTRYGI